MQPRLGAVVTGPAMAPKQNGAYEVCPRCPNGLSWIYCKKAKQNPFCKLCGHPWQCSAGASQQGAARVKFWQGAWSAKPEQQPQSVQQPTRQPRLRPRRLKGTEVMLENWATLPDAVKDALRQQGVMPEEERPAEDPLMALLREHRTNLPVKVQLELAKLDPAAPTALEAGFSAQNSFQQAVSKLKSLGSKKLVLQSRIDEAKAGLKKLLCDMQQLQSDIRTAQQDVDKIGGEYQEKVLQEPAAGAEPMDVEEIMGKLGLELNDDQKKRWSELKEEMEENKRRKKEFLDQVERPPGLVLRGSGVQPTRAGGEVPPPVVPPSTEGQGASPTPEQTKGEDRKNRSRSPRKEG